MQHRRLIKYEKNSGGTYWKSVLAFELNLYMHSKHRHWLQIYSPMGQVYRITSLRPLSWIVFMHKRSPGIPQNRLLLAAPCIYLRYPPVFLDTISRKTKPVKNNDYTHSTLSETIGSLGCRRNSLDGSMLIRQLTELQLFHSAGYHLSALSLWGSWVSYLHNLLIRLKANHQITLRLG